jgi:hypothetical protein
MANDHKANVKKWGKRANEVLSSKAKVAAAHRRYKKRLAAHERLKATAKAELA